MIALEFVTVLPTCVPSKNIRQELPLRVTGFKFKVPDQPTIQVNGNKLDSRAKQALSKAKRGSSVQIFDIEAKADGVSVILKKVSPVMIELTN